MNEIILSELRKLCAEDKIIWKWHATKRMQERNINPQDVERCIMTGEIIEQYLSDYPSPSCLVLGLAVNDGYLHVVCSIYQNSVCIITTYYPNPDEWEDDCMTRKVVK